MKLEDLDKNNIPQHVAIIMDGNGRWAQQQMQRRLFGHRQGLKAAHRAVEAAVMAGVKYLTLYTFSTENWNRPQEEVDGLMELLITAVLEETKTLMDNDVRLEMIGDMDRIPKRSRERLQACMDQTANNKTVESFRHCKSYTRISKCSKLLLAYYQHGNDKTNTEKSQYCDKYVRLSINPVHIITKAGFDVNEEADIEVEEDYELPEDMEFEDEDFGLDASENYYLDTAIAQGDMLSVGVHFYSFSGDDIVYNFCIDPATEEATYSLTTDDTRPQGGSEGIVHVGDYDVDPYWVYDDSYYIISVSDANGVVCEVDLQESLPDEDIFWIRGVMLIDDSNLLVSYTSNSSYGGSFFTLNLTNGAVEVVEGDDYEFLNQYAESNIAYFDGIGNVIIDTDGIKAVNFDSKELEEVFSWDSCNVNRSDITEMELISYSEDEIVFMGAAYRIGSGMSMVQLNDQQIITLTRAESNPNAGKTILTAASTGYINYAMSEAVCIFNESNPDFFIRFDTKYEVQLDAYDYIRRSAAVFA